METCPKCGTSRCEWVGVSTLCLRKLRAVPDVLECKACKHTWRYARSGRAVATRNFQRVSTDTLDTRA